MNGQNTLVNKIIEGLQEKKAKNIVIVDMTEIEDASFEHFIICEGTSTTQVGAIAESMMDYLRTEVGVKPFAYDGFQNNQWIAVDFGHIIVHVFLPEYRDFYKLEQLWADAKLTQIPDLD